MSTRTTRSIACVLSTCAAASLHAAPARAASWPAILSPLIGGVLVVLAVVAIFLRMRSTDERLARLVAKLEGLRNDRERNGNDSKLKRDDLAQMKSSLSSEIQSLRDLTNNLRSEIRQLATSMQSKPQAAAAANATPRGFAMSDRDDDYDVRAETRDPVSQLLSVANNLVRQNVSTLDAFRASAGSLVSRVSPWPNDYERPVAFLVEHGGSYYAIPNVVKPARLPKEWFNRGDFGVNDEIQQVVSLPRLTRRGDGYDVQEPGVFVR